jgi:hypothetical protein
MLQSLCHVAKQTYTCGFYGFHGGEGEDDYEVPDFGAEYIRRQMSAFRRNILCPCWCYLAVSIFDPENADAGKRRRLPTNLHGAKTQMIIIIVVVIKHGLLPHYESIENRLIGIV